MRIGALIVGAALAGLVGGCDTLGLSSSSGDDVSLKSRYGSGEPIPKSKAGAAIEALIGQEISPELDDEDRQAIYEAQFRALEFNRSGSPVAWKNPSSGNRGEVIPGPTYTINNSRCRDYSHTIFVDDAPKVFRGTACRQPNETWRSVS
ncbi:RT0821/Lpp0805 family surface protein [Rhodobium orientis]|uniref:Surface antigen domain-containing protein n=1 Tax=Rhodobium orientis TaxID=34017 RepID=A0A327JEG6_9HYPH|nr:RT0821/Lpp0805 family surface protein [Rhodobium orientis]MBK5949898.1 hypothetical protein [Rhodobium orientis]RAI24847.1 hypothetical protein CH339_20915 [Rhodobium orientis]